MKKFINNSFKSKSRRTVEKAEVAILNESRKLHSGDASNAATKSPTAHFSHHTNTTSSNAYEGPSYDNVQKIRNENMITSYSQYYRKPMLLHEGKMQWLFDHEGKRYLDMFGGIATVSVGHCHPKVIAATEKQMRRLWHSANVYQHPKLYEYAEALVSTLPNHLKVVYLVNSGSEANDLALLLARLHTKNLEIISFQNCYHGMSSFMMGVTSMSLYRYSIPVSSNVHHAVNPDVYQGLWGGSRCRDSLVQTDRKCDCSSTICQASENYYRQFADMFKYSLPSGHTAALIVEPIQGVGGTVQFPKGFLKKAFNLVHENGGVCIADEVQTGFGRTGDHFWGFEMHDVKPDIVTMAKGIANGFPMAAVVTTAEIAKSLSNGISAHFNTFGGNALACCVANSVLQVINEENMQANSKLVGSFLIQELAKLRDEFECVGDVRGKGLMIGVELVQDKVTKQPLMGDAFFDIWESCRDMGLLIGRGGLKGNVLRFKPPMCVTLEDACFTVDVFRRALFDHYKIQS